MAVLHWVLSLIYKLLLFIDGLIYSLVSYSFNIFLLMCQLNFNSLYAIIAPLVDRLQAVVLVFILYQVAKKLIEYMLNPDEAKGGGKLVINIAIACAGLILYNPIFSFFNELSLLIVGVPENYHFTSILSDLGVEDGGDPGLIMRFIFGEGADDVDDMGDFLALSTLQLFVYDFDGGDSSLNAAVVPADDEGKIDFMAIHNLSGDIGKTVKYNYPLVSAIMGIYLVYSIIMMSIQMGVRIFKLLVLQILAPIPILSIASDGTKSSQFQSFMKTYISVWMEVFARMASMLVVTVFVSKFLAADNIKAFLNETTGGDGVTGFFVLAIVIVAAYKVAAEIPKLIDQILQTHMSSDSGGGFFSTVKGIAGFGVGAVGGFASGMAAGGIGNALYNAGVGGFKGAAAGAKGKTIADSISNISKNGQASRDRALQIARQGGLMSAAAAGVNRFTGKTQRQQMQAQKYTDANKALDNMMAARASAIKNEQGTHGKFGDSFESYEKQAIASYESSDEYLRLSNDLEAARKSGDGQKYRKASQEILDGRKNASDAARSEYDAALFGDTANANSAVREASRTYDHHAKSHARKERTLGSHTIVQGREKSAKSSELKSTADVDQARKANANTAAQYSNAHATRRENRPGTYK